MSPPAATPFWAWVERWFHAPVPAVRLGAFRALVCAVALHDVLLQAPGVLAFAGAAGDAGAPQPWTPILLFQLFGCEPIGVGAAGIVQAVTVAALVAGAVGLWARLACAIGALGFAYWSGLGISSGMPQHASGALACALAALPFARVGAALSLDAVLRRWRGRGRSANAMVGAMPLRLTQCTVALGYFAAGVATLLRGGLAWCNGHTLQGMLLGHGGAWSRALAADVDLCRWQSIAVVGLQVSFPAVLRWPRLAWCLLPAATAWHLLAWQTMGAGPDLGRWLLLFAFVPMERIAGALRRALQRGPLVAAAVLLPVLGYVVLVATTAGQVLPAWLLVAVGVLLAVPVLRARRATASTG